MLTQFSLRPATPEDIAIVVQIEKQVHPTPWCNENFEAELGKPYSYFFVLTDDETDSQIVAYVVFWAMLDECQILNLAVDQNHRRAGFAKHMIHKIIQFTYQKGIKKIVLDVRKSNIPAIHLYQSLKFVITSIRKGFYSNGEDAYQMLLSLKEDLFEF